MTLRPLRALMLGSLMLPLTFATASLAQDHPASPSGEPGGPQQGHRHAWADPAARAAMMAKHLEREAARLRDALQLRPDQENALHAFLDSMKPPADAMARMHGPHADGDLGDGDHGDGDEEHLTTPQRLDRMLAKMDQHRARLVAHADAVKRFYAQLSPGQQKAFDALGPMGLHGMGGHRRPMDGHPGGPEGGQMGGPPPVA